MKYAALIMLILVGCKTCYMQTDQAVRQKLFQECLKLIPKGPEATTYNDWSEVVAECEDAAYYQSQVKVCSE
jgi:hypothetical protein